MRAPRAAVAIAAALVLASCSMLSPASEPDSVVVGRAPTEQRVAELPERSVATPPVMHLAEGVTPPTNRWYSSLAFGDAPLPVFASPLSFMLVEGGFQLGLPRVTASADAIVGPFAPDVTVTVEGASARPVVSHSDAVAVGLTYADGGPSVQLAAGWPAVGLTAEKPVSATLSVPFEAVAATSDGEGGAGLDDGETLAVAEVAGVQYGLLVRGGAVEGAELSLEKGGSAQWFAVPAGGTPEGFAAALGTPVTSVTTEYAVSDEAASTTLAYGPGGGETVLSMPRERAESSGLTCDLGTYLTVSGEQAVCRGASVTWEVPRMEALTALDLSGISEQERDQIREALREDAASLEAVPTDTYFGSKALYRLANLALLAEELGEEQLATELQDSLAHELRLWTEPDGCSVREEQCFVYDPAMKGVVGLAAAFGSDEFNDHHFHYGYLIYAAAVAVRDDPELRADIAPVIDLLAADIASGGESADFPERRPFDPYAGHSWASGTAPFADGNNQESSSEAVTAWAGVAAWADTRGDEWLTEQATWMLSAEADAANRLWMKPDAEAFPEYAHEVVPLVWGGKRVYATWFSAEPSALLGIELIPLAPVALQQLSPADDAAAEQIRAAVAEGVPGGSENPGAFEAPLGDYVLMYSALAGDDERTQAWDLAVALPQDGIDDGNSRAYMLAWIAATGGTE